MSAQKVFSLVIVAALLSITFVQASARPEPAARLADPGTIAYVHRTTHDIHLISPNGLDDRVLWHAPQSPGLSGAYDLAWRFDGRELAFSSDHEGACSWLQSDVYAIDYYGISYRRVTNAPACALLASLPKGSVTVDVTNLTSDLVWVYVQGAAGIQSILPYGAGTLTFNNVADLGPGILQPAIGIYGLCRIISYPPYADVKPNETVPGGIVNFSQYSCIRGLGTGKVSWKVDGSALAYGMRSGVAIRQIPANPAYGSLGADLPVVKDASPSLVAWGPTPDTKDLYLYYTDALDNNLDGIYVNTLDNTSGGAKLVSFDGQHVHDIEWLPDASGFIFSVRYVPLEIYSDIFEYNFERQDITRLTPNLLDESSTGGARGLSISPDGQQIAFERAIFPLDDQNSVWIIDRDGSDLHLLVADAGRPAWGQTPPPIVHVYLPAVVRGP